MVEEHLARKKAREAEQAAGVVVKDHSSERMRQFIRDLIRRFEEAGRADPAIVREVLEQMDRGVDGGS
ncbi:MAG: hypothetical protein K2X87_20655 [Gemmataceae bacterium]|nr:hypothetical protein [Gemmataceae bacterium]